MSSSSLSTPPTVLTPASVPHPSEETKAPVGGRPAEGPEDATTQVSEAAETLARMATLSPPVHPSALRELNNNTQVEFVRAIIQEGEATREVWRGIWQFENGTVLERDIDDKPLFQDPATDCWHEEELLAWNAVEDELFFEPKEEESAEDAREVF